MTHGQHFVTERSHLGGSKTEPSPRAGAVRPYSHSDEGTQKGETRPGRRTTPRHIDAQHLKLALQARKARPIFRWAAMSNGAATAACQPRQPGGGYWMHMPPLLAPMATGWMLCLLDRARSQGRSEVLRTWRTSIAVLRQEFSSCMLRGQRGTP